MKTITRFFILLCLLSSLGIGANVLAGVQEQAQGDHGRCMGSHCTIVATYFAAEYDDKNRVEQGSGGMHTTMSMDTLLIPFDIAGLSETGPTDTPVTFQVPIDASGEIVGHAVEFYDSPPITFEANGVVRAITEGLKGCRVKRFSFGALEYPVSCDVSSDISKQNLDDTTFTDLLGTWSDNWQAYVDDGSGSYSVPTNQVTCQTSTLGATATCNATADAGGIVRLELTRSVSDLEGQLINTHQNINLPLVALHADRIWPAVMTDSILVEFEGAALTNHPPQGEVGVRIDGGPVWSSGTVVQGEPVQVRLVASEDITGDGVGSYDPDGWDHPTLGVANGGTCAWNADLDQGATTTFEHIISNPASPAVCDLDLGVLTFNDDPGTYTYSVFNLTDGEGASDEVTISITVLPAGATVPPATPTPVAPPATNSVSPSPNPSVSPGTPECADGLDNDGDGNADCADNGCWSDPTDSTSCNPDDDSEQFVPDFDPGPFQETE